MATMVMTAATPMTMPSTERNVRMRLRSNARIAIFAKVSGAIVNYPLSIVNSLHLSFPPEFLERVLGEGHHLMTALGPWVDTTLHQCARNPVGQRGELHSGVIDTTAAE